jgi:hypothetical protein
VVSGSPVVSESEPAVSLEPDVVGGSASPVNSAVVGAELGAVTSLLLPCRVLSSSPLESPSRCVVVPDVSTPLPVPPTDVSREDVVLSVSGALLAAPLGFADDSSFDVDAPGASGSVFCSGRPASKTSAG